MAKQDAITAREKEKQQAMSARTVFEMNKKENISKERSETMRAIQDARTASAKLTSTGKPQDYYNETDGRYHTKRLGADGKEIDVTHPEGYIPIEIMKQREISNRAKNKNQPIGIEGMETPKDEKKYQVKNKKTGQYEYVTEEQYNMIKNQSK
jgi:hypothetical protein